MWRRTALLTALVCLTACGEADPPKGDRPGADGWLLAEANEQERFALIQRQLRGFDQPMWEVGERYVKLHEALERGNPELATYHWEKIRTTVENGIAKRPARGANAELFLLGGPWAEIDADLKSGDPQRAWAGFDRARAACQGCHEAEGVAYMNDQSIFDLAGPRGTKR